MTVKDGALQALRVAEHTLREEFERVEWARHEPEHGELLPSERDAMQRLRDAAQAAQDAFETYEALLEA